MKHLHCVGSASEMKQLTKLWQYKVKIKHAHKTKEAHFN